MKQTLFQAKAENEKREADIMINELKEDINVRTHEAQREGRKRDKLDRELKTSRLDLEAKNSEIKNKQGSLQKLQEECGRLETGLKEQKVRSSYRSTYFKLRFVHMSCPIYCFSN